jgi:hypothetical protein
LLRGTTNRDTKGNHTDELKGFGRGRSAPLVISSLEIPTPVDERVDESYYFLLPRVEVGLCRSNGERPLAVSPTKYGLIRGCSHPKGMTTR